MTLDDLACHYPGIKTGSDAHRARWAKALAWAGDDAEDALVILPLLAGMRAPSVAEFYEALARVQGLDHGRRREARLRAGLEQAKSQLVA